MFEYGFDGSGWYKSDLKWPGKATSAISWSDGQDHIRVYVINEDAELVEQCWDSASGWTVGTTWNYEPLRGGGVPIAAEAGSYGECGGDEG